MLKHVQISPLRNRSDSVSLRSATSCASSLCGSPEPPSDLQRIHSRASSYSSLNETLPQTTIKVYTSCLRIDIEYKTLGIQWDTTSKEVISRLLRRLKMRHRDPRLFYLSMEVTVRRAGVKTVFVLDDEARPAMLQACHPKGDSRFCLQLKPGGLIRVHTSVLQSSSQYKSLVISEETTSDELLSLLLSCYNSAEPVEQFSLYEVCPGQEYQRKLHPDDLPLRAQSERIKRGENCHFLVRRNPNYPRRRQLLSESDQSPNTVVPAQLNTTTAQLSTNQIEKSSENSLINSNNNKSEKANRNQNNNYSGYPNENSSVVNTTKTAKPSSSSSCSSLSFYATRERASTISSSVVTSSITIKPNQQHDDHMKSSTLKSPTIPSSGSMENICKMCHNNFKSCEFCHKNSSTISNNNNNNDAYHYNKNNSNVADVNRRNNNAIVNSSNSSRRCYIQNSGNIQTYNPVYNIREIRNMNNSFASLSVSEKRISNGTSGKVKTLTKAASSSSLLPAASSAIPTLNSSETIAATSSLNGAAIVEDKNNANNSGRPNSLHFESAHNQQLKCYLETLNDNNGNGNSVTELAGEAVKNNPAKGYGHYVYI